MRYESRYGAILKNGRHYDRSMNTVARQIVQDFNHISDFGYHGTLPLGKTWGFTFSVHRDSDRLERSNWEVISNDLLKKHPNTVEIVHCGHWLVGWVDHLAVKMIDKNGRITRAGIDVLDWLEKLDGYPVADEDHYSRLESDENYENALESIRSETYRADMIDGLPENWKGLVYEWLRENRESAMLDSEDRSEGWIDGWAINDACKALGYIVPDDNES